MSANPTNRNSNSTHTSRRKFMTTLGLGGAAAAAVVVLKQVAEPNVAGGGNPASATSDKPADKGYQLTSHVRNYYRTTQV